jgi:T5SS/PEP-CTERM-associated repeat protein
LFLRALAIGFSLLAPLSTLHAALTATGDVSPSDPTTWNYSTEGYIGNSSTGNLTADGGSNLYSGDAYLAYGTASSGTVTVTGTGSKWITEQSLYVGESGSGTLNVTRGATVNTYSTSILGDQYGSTGLATVDGTGSTWECGQWLAVGKAGVGTLNISNGGTAYADGVAVGDQYGASGVVTVDGTGSNFHATYGITVGYQGTGTVTVTHGATVTTDYSTFVGGGNGSSSQVTVDGTGSTWTSSHSLSVSSGTLQVTHGGTVSSMYSYLGSSSGLAGVATVDGTGSTWTSSADLYVGSSGSGTLNITGGSAVTVGGATYVGSNPGATGTINFGPSGGTLTAQTLYASPSQLTGTGTINTRGLVSDGNLVFDSTASLTQVLTFNQPGQNVTVNLTAGSGDLGAGAVGSGSLTVKNGVTVHSRAGCLGYSAGSNGVATIDGSGSTWANTGDLTIGRYGNGTLNLTNGGTVTVGGTTYLASYPGSTGTINFGTGGGTLTTVGLVMSPTQLLGTGTINARGLIGDFDLAFDSAASLTRTLNFNQPGQNIALKLDMGTNPSSNGSLGAGATGNGSLTIHNGTSVQSASGYVGYSSGSVGVATVDGAGSAWTTGSLTVGNNGHGTLNITHGATVNSNIGFIGYASGSAGVVNVDGVGSMWSGLLSTLYVGYSGTGILNISNGGTVNAADPYDIEIGVGGAGTVTVDGKGSTLNVRHARLNIGSSAAGTLNITRGGNVTNSGAEIGSLPMPGAASGVVNVDGSGSTWNTAYSNGVLDVGEFSSGTLNITGGGNVTSGWDTFLGGQPGISGTTNVDGAGSKWTMTNGLLSVGSSGVGTLNLSGGGTATAQWVQIASNSAVGIDVGAGSSLSLSGNATITSGTTTVTNGTITNNGTVRVVAGAGVAKGKAYSPITATTWNGSGIYQALGGTWDSTNHVFTVSDVQTGTAGTPVSIDLDNEQRVLVSDGKTRWSVGASFLASTTSKPLSLTATTIDSSTLSSLQGLLGAQQAVLGGWDFAFTSGYTAGDPAYLSFGIGSGYSRNGLEVWHYDGSNWTPFAANDLTYDGTYASFTVTGFSGYAVTTVPEPGTLALLVAAGLGLCVYGGRKQRKQ